MQLTSCSPKTIWGIKTEYSSDCSLYADCVPTEAVPGENFCVCGYGITLLQNSAKGAGHCELSSASIGVMVFWFGMTTLSLLTFARFAQIFVENRTKGLIHDRSDPLLLSSICTFTSTILIALKCATYGLRTNPSFGEDARVGLDIFLAVIGGLLTGAYAYNLMLYGIAILLILARSAKMVALNPKSTQRLKTIVLRAGFAVSIAAVFVVGVPMLYRLYLVMAGVLTAFSAFVLVLYVFTAWQIQARVKHTNSPKASKMLNAVHWIILSILMFATVFTVASALCFFFWIQGLKLASKSYLSNGGIVSLGLLYIVLLGFQGFMAHLAQRFFNKRAAKMEKTKEFAYLTSSPGAIHREGTATTIPSRAIHRPSLKPSPNSSPQNLPRPTSQPNIGLFPATYFEPPSQQASLRPYAFCVDNHNNNSIVNSSNNIISNISNIPYLGQEQQQQQQQQQDPHKAAQLLAHQQAKIVDETDTKSAADDVNNDTEKDIRSEQASPRTLPTNIVVFEQAVVDSEQLQSQPQPQPPRLEQGLNDDEVSQHQAHEQHGVDDNAPAVAGVDDGLEHANL